MNDKMIDAFRNAKGGLFSKVEKADVGNSYEVLRSKGVDLLGWADPFMPDRSLPEFVERAWIDAVRDESSSHYTAPIGSIELKRNIAEKLRLSNGISVDPERNIIITPGSDSGLYFAMLPFIQPGNEVIIPSPSYPNNALDVRIMGGVPIPVRLEAEQGYQISKSDLASAVTPNTKMIVLTHPNNPTTTVFNRASLDAVATIAIEHDLILVVDQAFEDFTFEHEMISPAALDGMFERTVSVFSFSKGMGLSGLRVGYLVCDDAIMDSMFANAVAVLGATSTSAQTAVLAALRAPQFMNGFGQTYDRRRHQAFKIMNSIPGVKMLLPESGFLCWADVSQLGQSDDIVSYLIERARVAVNSGLNYGPGGEGHIRIVLGAYHDDERVFCALRRIRSALIEYGNR